MPKPSSLTPRLRFWAAHLHACTERKQTLSAYAAEHGLAVGALYEAKSRLKRLGAWPAAAPRPRFVQVAEIVGAQPAPVRCRVRLPNGVVVDTAGAEVDAVLAAAVRLP